jgi:hypothetical protein
MLLMQVCMPKYFFDSREGDQFIHDNGIDLDGPEDALV